MLLYNLNSDRPSLLRSLPPLPPRSPPGSVVMFPPAAIVQPYPCFEASTRTHRQAMKAFKKLPMCFSCVEGFESCRYISKCQIDLNQNSILYITMKQTATMFFRMNHKRHILITQKGRCQCFLKIFLQPKSGTSHSKRYEFIESFL